MPESIASYHARRAAAERMLAASAPDAFIAKVHYELAALHETKAGEDRVSSPALSPTPERAHGGLR